MHLRITNFIVVFKLEEYKELQPVIKAIKSLLANFATPTECADTPS